MKAWDEALLREAILIAIKARDNGNHPFGALLADAEGRLLLRAENSVITENDCTNHAETNLVRMACKQFTAEFLSTCTLYASTEPCPMCAGAIFWANIRRVVFGLSETSLYDLVVAGSEEALMLTCKDLFAYGKKEIEVVGPLLESEALAVHLGFWQP